MAIKALVTTSFGEDRELYIRLNNLEASNHDVESTALFRGFASQAAYEEGKGFMWERDIMFKPDVALPLWGQAYEVLKSAINVDGCVIEDC